MFRKKKSIKDVIVSTTGQYFVDIYEDDYAWLPIFFEEIGFSRTNGYTYKNSHITDFFIHISGKASLLLTLDFSLQRRSRDVIGICLIQTENTSADKRWSVLRSELTEEHLKNEIQLAVNAFVRIKVSFADYDDNEPLYLYSQMKPLLRGEEYYISKKEKWIHAKSLGQLYIDAYGLGYTELYDVRPVRIENGLKEGVDKNEETTGGFLWENGYGGFVHNCLENQLLNNQGKIEGSWLAMQEIKERITENNPEIFPQEDVSLCLDNKIESYKKHLSCPFCGKPSEELYWLRFCIPAQTWENLSGRSGALSICMDCGWQIEFICEVMN